MKFKVLKSGPDGISGGASDIDSIEGVLREVMYFAGWPSRLALHDSIRKWATAARPGAVFTTQVTAIVAVAVDCLDREDDQCHHCGHEGLDYEDIGPVDGGDLEQEVTCPGCGKRWLDVFTLVEQREVLP